MARRTDLSGGLRNMDSLVDIVSNIVGILIILAAFMALFSLINPKDMQEQDNSDELIIAPQKLLVPWSHPTNKSPILFVMQGNRILHLDMRAFYQTLAEKAGGERPEPLTIDQPGAKIKFYPVTNQVYCLEFVTKKDAGETWLSASAPGSLWKRAQKLYNSEGFYYFFWVAGDSFELFRDVRKMLWDDNFEVGWKPYADKSSLQICNGFEGASGFQPQ